MRTDTARRATACLLLAVLMGLGTACGMTAPRDSDGYANLESLGMLDVDNVFTISLGPALLRFAAAHVDDEPETRALLRQLHGVRIRVYEIDGDASRVAARMSRMQLHLQDDGWMPVMLVRDEDSTMNLLVKQTGDAISGLTLLTSDGESEAVVINLMGDIRPENFSDVVVALDMDVDAPGADRVQVAQVGADL